MLVHHGVMGLYWGHLEAILRPSWGHFGPILGYLGPIFGHIKVTKRKGMRYRDSESRCEGNFTKCARRSSESTIFKCPNDHVDTILVSFSDHLRGI